MLATPSRTPETASTPATFAASTAKITRGHSCVLCQQRKVKCDRQKPCANCTKARTECVVAPPTLPRRRRRKLTESDLITKLRRYEQLLKTHGVKFEDEDSSADTVHTYKGDREEIDSNDVRRLTLNVPRPVDAEKGALFCGRDSSYYVENTLWENLRDEIQDPQGSSEDDVNETGLDPDPESVLMGFTAASKDLSTLHPPVVHIFRLWQIFLDNVNPLTKMFHAPTVQQTILDASGNIENVSRPNEALMFAIYFLAIISMTNQDCESLFAEPRQKLLTKYAHGVQQALINARFLKTLNLTTLQALTLYLIGSRRLFDPHTVWTLSGVAVRIAQRLGIHRDTTTAKLSPFDAEMRRRTWWQIVFLDGHASKLAGAPFPAWFSKFNTQLPLNISDSELSPTMNELPASKEGATEMIFCSMRYEVVQALRNAGTFRALGEDGCWHTPTGPELIAEKDKAIEELERQFERKYIRYCDPSIPLHLLMIYVAKSVICTMKIMSHHPRQYPDKGASMPQREKDMLFKESLTELELDSEGHEHKSIQGYLWHVHTYFQLDAFIYILSELRTRTTGDLVERAWEQIRLAYEYRPELINDSKNSLHVGIGNLTLKAWAKREEAMNSSQVLPPRFISLLRARRNISEHPKPMAELKHQDSIQSSNTAVDYRTVPPQQNTAIPNQMDMWQDMRNTEMTFDVPMPEITPVDWEYWQTLMDGELPAYTGEPIGKDWF